MIFLRLKLVNMITILFSIPQWYRVFLSMIYLGIIALLSLLPTNDLPQIPIFAGADKIIHALMYAGLTLLICWMIYAERKQSMYYLIVLFSISWGIVMELCQSYMHLGRSFEYFDILGNSIGTFIGLCIYIMIIIRYRTLTNNLHN